ncbi:LysR family transcriptional regulator [Phaeovibrio sulfidiphilus]|nr:LysR family transcriptional regulator [Phaeovibrio sulfidiphilus]
MPQRLDVMDWDKLRVFHTVAEAGSFTRAGDFLNLSQSAVSRQIGALEEALGAPLFLRHPRGLVLTEQGTLLFETTRSIVSNLTELESRLDEQADDVSGPLTICTSLAFGTLWLTPRLKTLTDRYPKLELSVTLTDVSIDLGTRRADLAVRFIASEQQDLIQRHLVRMPYRVLASREYLQRYGVPRGVEDLDRHKILAYGNELDPPADNLNWLLSAGLPPKSPPRQPALRINNLLAIHRAVGNGMGIAALPGYFLCDSPCDEIVSLPGFDVPSLSLYFLYTKEMRYRKRVEVFRDFLISELKACGLNAPEDLGT